MHVHASYNVPVAYKATAPTGPVASFRLLLPVASRTVATGSPLTATEARDANLFTLVLQIVLILAVFPLRHALVVVASLVFLAHAMRIAHIERLHPCLLAEVDHLPRPLMPQVPHPPFLLAPFPLPCILQAAPALGAFLTTSLQARELAQRLVVLPFDAAHPSPSHDEGLTRAGRHRRLVVE